VSGLLCLTNQVGLVVLGTLHLAYTGCLACLPSSARKCRNTARGLNSCSA